MKMTCPSCGEEYLYFDTSKLFGTSIAYCSCCDFSIEGTITVDCLKKFVGSIKENNILEGKNE